MSQGFVAYNANNQILISSDTRNLHLVSKLNSPSVTNQSNAYGAFRELTYYVNSSVTPVPFFTMPTGDYYGIAGIRHIGGITWEIRIIRSGTSGVYPEVYVFADPRAVANADTHGMIVYRDDGTAAFDSRRQPLAVTGGTAVAHPSNPRSYIPTMSDWQCSSSPVTQFSPDSENGPYDAGSISSKPMFHYSSLAQAERQATWSGYDEDCDGIDLYGNCLGFSRSDEWTSTYWAFYRGGIRSSGNQLYAGWITVRGGCWWSSWSDSGFFGIDTGGGSAAGGVAPYSNETINLSAAAVIVGDASRYD